MEALKRLKLEGEHLSEMSLPTEQQVRVAEEKLGVTFPLSYVTYQLKYSNYSYGIFEPYLLIQDGGHLDLINSVAEAREQGLPDYLLPFLEDNGDYYCFDLSSSAQEYEVRFWSHNGTTNEKWENFLHWVESCWLEEQGE